MRIIGMEKEKRKGSPRKRRIIIGVLTVILLLIACSFWAWSSVVTVRSLSEFSRFENEEEVVAFLHEHFDLYVTTSDDIRTFLAAYPLEDNGCRDWTPTPGDFAGYVVNEEVTNIMICWVPAMAGLSIGGTHGYQLLFYINMDDKLEYIGAKWYCNCL
jgi:hypothetical protein